MKTATRKKQMEIAEKPTLEPNATISAISANLQSLQRQRSVVLKSRNMQANRLQAIIAGDLGYHSRMAEKDRTKKFVEATALIKSIIAGTASHRLEAVIRTTMIGIDAFNDIKVRLEKEMIAQAKLLPIRQWVEAPEQRGFGLLFLAIIIGETGDLCNYANPAKVWRRMGCAPWSFNGKTLMGATWKSGKAGKLPSDEWEKFGYSPRRRSIAFLIGEGIVKQNGASKADELDSETEPASVRPCGPYRNRYDEAKVIFKENHPDYSDLRCHRHAMLVATKLLLKNLWIEWNKLATEML